jgi:arylsulfatase A-like enzyme
MIGSAVRKFSVIAGLILGPGLVDDSIAAGRGPNIIYVMIDDAGYGDFSAFGSPHVKTPTFDRMCAEGMKFTQHYSGSAVCAPTRCVLMTGLHTGHARRRDNTAKGLVAELSAKNGRPLVFLEDEDLTVAEVLKTAGYVTGGIGKWGLGNPGSSGVPENQGFDYWYGYLDQVHAHDHFPGEIWDGGRMVKIPENEGKRQNVYIPYEMEKKTLSFIREHKDDAFFLYLAYTPPHGAYIIPKTDPNYASYAGIPGGDKVRHYAAMITRTDQTVGKMLGLLKELKLDENTIVFYTSDNGPNAEFANSIDSANGLRGTKTRLYEGGIRAAMAVRWPGKVPAGVTSDFVWDMRDVFPTACDLVGVKAPAHLDGLSVKPTLLGGTQKGREMHYWEIHSPFQQAVRFGDWKGIRYGTKEPLELYNLREDRAESRDVAGEQPGLVKRLEAFLAGARTETPYFPAVEKKSAKGGKKNNRKKAKQSK